MALLDDATRLADTSKPGVVCAVKRAISDHPDMAAEILDLLHARQIAARNAAIVFHAHGLPISAQTVGRHRRNDCSWCRT